MCLNCEDDAFRVTEKDGKACNTLERCSGGKVTKVEGRIALCSDLRLETCGRVSELNFGG